MMDRHAAQKPRTLFLSHILRKVFLEDWALKLLALAISVGLWLAVTGLSTPTTRRLTIPLDYAVASNAQVVSSAQQVDVEISGDKSRIEQIRSGDLVASLDLTDTRPGSWTVTLSPDTVSVPLPQGVKLIDVAPGRIAVTIEAVEEKELEVRPDTDGRPAPGYEVYSAVAIPAKIRVRGPSSVLNELEVVQTEKIDIDGRRDGFTARQAAVVPPDSRTAVLNTVVDVVFRIGERRIERSFSLPAANDATKTINVTLFGPRTELTKLRPTDLQAEIVLMENGEEGPRIVLPAGREAIIEIKDAKIANSGIR